MLLLAVALAGFIAASAGADCTQAPQLSAANNGPDLQGDGTIHISYGFPDTTSPNQRSISIYAGVPETTRLQASADLTASGAFDYQYSLTCQPPGSYKFRVVATTCSDGTKSVEQNAFATVATDKPTINATYVGPDAQGHGSIGASYTFPNTKPNDRALFLNVGKDGVFQFYSNFFLGENNGNLAESGSIVPHAFPLTCWPTGTYTFQVTARACGAIGNTLYETVGQTAATVDLRTSVHGVYTSIPGQAGNFDVSYVFPNTDDSAQRWLGWSLDGVQLDQFVGNKDQQGVYPRTLDMRCQIGSHTVMVEAISCSNTPDSESQNTTTITVPEPQVSGTATADPIDAASYNVNVTYSFPDSPARTITLSWVPKGDSPGGDFYTVNPLDLNGTLAPIKVTPDATHDEIKITASACGHTAKGLVKLTDHTCDCSKQELAPACVGKPVRVSDGNMRYSERTPLPAGAFAEQLSLTFDSEAAGGYFGIGWTSIFDARLRLWGGYAFVDTERNNSAIFAQTINGYVQIWPAGATSLGTLRTLQDGNLEYREPQGRLIRTFQPSDGHLIAIANLAAQTRLTITYDAATSAPQRVTDGNGNWEWVVTQTTSGNIDSIAITGRPDLRWTYQYVGHQLVGILAPDGSPWRTYQYAATGGLTAAKDGSGRIIEEHSYADAAHGGFATTSLASSDDITAISYRTAEAGLAPGETVTAVTSATGRVSKYYLRTIAGRLRTVRIDGGCTSCGTGDAVYAYDASGHVVRIQNARGYITLHTYDPAGTHLLTTTTALKPVGCDPETDTSRCRLTQDSIASAPLVATSASDTTSYEYGDAYWPDDPTRITRASIAATGQTYVEEFTIDPASGTVVQRRQTGYSTRSANSQTRTTTTTLYNGTESAVFDPGGAYSAAILGHAQPAGLVKRIDGPRTDVSDIRDTVYYPIDPSIPATWRGRIAASRAANGDIVRYEDYDPFGNAKRVIDANGVTTTRTFDVLGRALTATVSAVAGCDTTQDPLCGTDVTSSQSYEAGAGSLVLATRPGGMVTTYEYDNRGRLSALSRGPASTDLRERIEYDYDAATGQRSVERYRSRQGGNWTTTRTESFLYDSFARRTETTHADGTNIYYAYDGLNNLLTVRDERHSAANTTYAYDPADRLRSVRQTLGTNSPGYVTTSYSYDVRGNLRSVTDPNGNVTSYEYDDFGEMEKQTSPVTGVTTYSYDAAGNLLSTTDAAGATTTRSYDSSNRSILALAVKGSAPSESVAWAYDDTSANPFGKGRLTSMTDPTGSTVYRYERRGWLAEERKTVEGNLYSTRYTYDADANRNSIVYPSRGVVTYAFDFAGRPYSATAGAVPLVTSAAYLPFGPASSLTFGNGTTQTTAYDARYQLQENKLSGPSANTIADYTYTHDPAGNIASIHDVVDSSYDRNFTYDDLNRLVTANTGASLWGTGTYGYDAMGNMLSSAIGTKSSAFSYNGVTPTLKTVTEAGQTRQVVADASGNELRIGTALYDYSARGSLIGSGSLSYTYDGRGIRTIATSPCPGTVTRRNCRRRALERAAACRFSLPSTARGSHRPPCRG
jgi:YD repeat-containing protein